MAGILSKLFGGTGQRQVETRYTPIPGSISPEYDKMRIKEIEKLEKAYDFHSIEGVQAIPVPCKQVNHPNSVTGAVEYYLRTRAGVFWVEGDHALAIECLRKSNQLLEFSTNSVWEIFDYARLVEYLKNDGQWDEARAEEKRLKEKFHANSIYRTKKEERNRYEYDWMREFAPDIAPKSFGGFMRMKNEKTKNYIKISKEAKARGFKPLK